MATTWGGCALAGACVARYCKQYPWWVNVHRGFVSLGAFMTIPLTFLAFYSHVDAHYGTYHGKLGLSVACMSFGQGILGSVLFGKFGVGPCSCQTPACCNLEGGARARHRKYVARLHRLLGWVTVLLAFTTIFFGIWALSCEAQCMVISNITYAFFGYMAVLIVPFLCLESRHRRLKRIIHIQVPTTPHASIDGLQPMLSTSLDGTRESIS